MSSLKTVCLIKLESLKKKLFWSKKTVKEWKFKVDLILDHPLVVGSNGRYKEIKGSLIFSILVVKETEKSKYFQLDSSGSSKWGKE